MRQLGFVVFLSSLLLGLSSARAEINLTEIFARSPDQSDWARLREQSPGHWLPLTNGMEIRYEVFQSQVGEDSPTVIFLGGLGYDLERLLDHPDFVQAISARARLIYLELPGQGLTLLNQALKQERKIPETFPEEDQKKILSEAVTLLHERIGFRKKPSLMGLSYGGWLLLDFASDPRYQEQIGQLVLLAPGAVNLGRFLYPAARVTPPGALPEDDKMHRKAVENYLHRKFPHLDADPVRLSGSLALYMGIRTVDGIEAAGKIPPTIPSHLFTAEKDVVIPPHLHGELGISLGSRKDERHGISATTSFVRLREAGHDIPKESTASDAELISRIVADGQSAGIGDFSATGEMTTLTLTEMLGNLYQGFNAWLKENAWWALNPSVLLADR